MNYFEILCAIIESLIQTVDLYSERLDAVERRVAEMEAREQGRGYFVMWPNEPNRILGFTTYARDGSPEVHLDAEAARRLVVVNFGEQRVNPDAQAPTTMRVTERKNRE